ncbi:MAG TPA: MotA/TolQ/ExbB proton channel family protein [Lacunisphaera sp.]|jgi:biopolymer transport protein ExbB/TolQ
MKALFELCARGGPVMIAIIGLSVLLYTRSFLLLFWLGAERRLLNINRAVTRLELQALNRRQEKVHEAFRQQRMVAGAMIAAAPLLGLLGTVVGMIRTFASLSDRLGEKSMEGLAHGISEVLVATESGLAVAIPGLLLMYVAHRKLLGNRQRLNRLEMEAGQLISP